MSKIVNSVVEIGSFGLVKDVSGVEAAQDAANKAAGIQAQGAEAGIAEQRRQFDITQGNLQPFQQAGVSALEQQRILLGLGGTPQQDPNLERRNELTSQISAMENKYSASPNFGGGAAGRVASNLNSRGMAEIQGLRDELSSIPAFNPSQVSAQDQQRQAFEAFNESPGQKFMRDRAQKNLLRNSSAIGGLGGGNVRSALVEQGAGFAQQDFNNQFSRLGQIAGQGQAATTNLGQFGAQTAGDIANLGIAGSQARASGILGGQQAEAQFRGQLLELGGQAIGAFAGGA